MGFDFSTIFFRKKHWISFFWKNNRGKIRQNQKNKAHNTTRGENKNQRTKIKNKHLYNDHCFSRNKTPLPFWKKVEI